MSLAGVRRVRDGHHRGDPHRDLRPAAGWLPFAIDTTIQRLTGHGYARPRCLVARTPATTGISLESSRVRPVRPAGDAAGRGRADAVAGHRAGAWPGGFDIGQLVRLGVPARLAAPRT